jgi:hypothetical protein
VGVDRVRLEVVGEGSGGELVEDAALVDAEVVPDLVVTPVGEISRVVIDLEQLSNNCKQSPSWRKTYRVVAIATNKSHCVRQNSPGNSIGRGNANTGDHGLLGLLGHNSGIEFHKVRMLVQTSKRLHNVRVRVDLFESLVGLQLEEFAELVEGAHVPLPALDDAQDFNVLQNLWYVPCAERAFYEEWSVSHEFLT